MEGTQLVASDSSRDDQTQTVRPSVLSPRIAIHQFYLKNAISQFNGACDNIVGCRGAGVGVGMLRGYLISFPVN